MSSLVDVVSQPVPSRADHLIRDSWNRARLLGLDPEALKIERIDPLIDEHVSRSARRVIDATATSLDDTNTWISLANLDGAITYQWAATEVFRKQLDRLNVGEGAVINEELVGPSGIAIALKSSSQVVVKGNEHYHTRWRNLVCAASPVIHPLTQEVLAAVNVTCLAVEQNKHLRIALKTVTGGIQQLLALGLRSQQRQLIDAHAQTKNASRAPVITLNEETLIIERDLEFLELSPREIRRSVDELNPSARETRLPTGHLVRVVRHELGPSSTGVSLVLDRAAFQRSLRWRTISETADIRLSPLEHAERKTISSVLIAANGNKKTAADILGISRGTLYDRLHRYGLVFED